MAVIFLVFFLFVSQAESISDEIKVYQFNPDLNADNFLAIEPKTPTSQSTGYSFCLRAIFWTWNYRILVETENTSLGLQDPKQNIGFFRTNIDYFQFPLENVVVSPTIWNSFCVSFNQTDFLVSITVNGQLVSTSNSSVGFKPNNITIGGNKIDGRFYGQITDFNFWNKPLALTEMEEFSSGCNTYNLLENLKPEFVLWSEVNITLKGNSTTNYSMTQEMLCSILSQNSASDSIFLFGYSVTYQESITTCEELNGKILHLGNEDKAFLKKEEASLNKLCYNRFWVYTNITEENKNNHELISDGHSMKLNEKCLYYDASYQIHHQMSCKEHACFCCQISEDRLKYQVKSSWDHIWYLESNYFLVNFNGQLAFASWNGQNFLFYSSESKWSAHLFNLSKYVHVGYMYGKTIFPIGLQNFALNNRWEYLQVKITDVSDLF